MFFPNGTKRPPLTSYTSKVSPNPAHKYVTQSSVYDCPLLGPLTNRQIAKYKREGHYPTGFVDSTEREREQKAKSASPKSPKGSKVVKPLVTNSDPTKTSSSRKKLTSASLTALLKDFSL